MILWAILSAAEPLTALANEQMRLSAPTMKALFYLSDCTISLFIDFHLFC